MLLSLHCRFLSCFAVWRPQAEVPAELDRYNLGLDDAERTDPIAMPLRNGEVAISLWVEENGDLQSYTCPEIVQVAV